jgi:hypothetical protein
MSDMGACSPGLRAKRILREKNEGSSFWAPINYPKQGLV